MVTFILGASDPEMQFIKEAVQLARFPYVQATYENLPVKPHRAYMADGYQGHLLGYPVFVECEVRGFTPIHVIDHHRMGDPGYGKTPDNFWLASSIGQTIHYLVHTFGVDPDEAFGDRLTEYQMAAAADHCLTAAYRGLCPGIDPDDLAYWRASQRARYQGVPLDTLLNNIAQAKRVMQQAETIQIDGVDVAVIKDTVPELPEASAQMGMAFQADSMVGNLPRRNIMSAPPHVIEAWMHQARDNGLTDIYGDPQRGFAGAFVREVT